MLLARRTIVMRPKFALGTEIMDAPSRPALRSAHRTTTASLTLRKPVQVHDADFLENSDVGDAVDLSKFPVPHWHQKDGGQYIGSGSLVIMCDPDSGWVNASIYRVQV